MNQNVTRADPSDAGCWIDGHWGHYGLARLVDIAVAHGWADAEAADLAARDLAAMGPSDAEGLTADESERLTWAADDAETWMNGNVAPVGYFFGWHDGEYFLSSAAWWSEDGGPWADDWAED